MESLRHYLHICGVCRVGGYRISCARNCKQTSSIASKRQAGSTTTRGKKTVTVIDCNSTPSSVFRRRHPEDYDIVSPATLRSLDHALGECYPSQSKQLPRKNSKSSQPSEDLPTPRPSDGPYRFNEINIQMLPESLHRHLFGAKATASPSPELVRSALRARKELQRRGLLRAPPAPIADPGVRLPRLRGADVEEHFRTVGEEQSGPYRALLQGLAAAPEPPPPPAEWQLRVGWTRYAPEEPPLPVPFPACDALVLDVEVCRAAGEAPVLATAASPAAWYCWVSPRLAAASAGPAATPPRRYSADDFLPLESEPATGTFAPGVYQRPRVVVGHNVSYDRARVREQYWLERSSLRFVDTMSLHVCVGGLASGQRAALRSSADAEPEDAAWREVAALNSLADVHRLYCGAPLDKAARDLFVTGQLAEVRADFQSATAYCAGDVAATWRVLAKVLPLFLERFPHPVSLAGLLELGGAYLPVGAAWPRFLASAERTYDELRAESRRMLARAADDACALLHAHAYCRDPWMWDQDWSVQELRLRKTAPKKRASGTDGAVANEDFDPDEWPEKFRNLAATRYQLPAKRPLLPGYPAWYRNLCDRPGAEEWTPGPARVSTGLQVTPKLLRLTWEGYPLHYVREHGWGFLVPREGREGVEEAEAEDAAAKPPLTELLAMCPVVAAAGAKTRVEEGETAGEVESVRREVQERLGWASRRGGVDGTASAAPLWYIGAGVRCGASVGGCWFLKLPHKDGAARVGSPMARDFLGAFEAGVLAGAGPGAARVLDVGRQLSYWRNNRERVLGQLVGWLPAAALPRSLRAHGAGLQLGAIVPQVVAAGTLTRRAVEPTWMTAANAKPGRLGSELRALVHAPPGHAFVGADVDSQELWIAAVLGDASAAGIHGGTPFGWMTLSGSKADGTDMHSVTAAAAGVSRDEAKVLNYARIYGAGPRFAQRLLQRFNPALGDAEARARATKMFALTKGRRVWRARPEWAAAAEDAGGARTTSALEARRRAQALGATTDEVFGAPRWEGGTESAMFNRLEEIANAAHPATPFLGGRLSRALEAAVSVGDDDRFLPTRVNWVVQSGAVDFLHLMLVCMRWLQPRARFCLSFHDEVRYLVAERDRHRAALALHATNLLARAFCAQRLGLTDLPAAVAFFASVEVDAALRKDAHHDCATPSNPHGLRRGYGVAPGEALDVYKTVARAGGVLRAPRGASAAFAAPSARTMSAFTKRKHVEREVLEDTLQVPTEQQKVVRVLAGRGNNLHEVEEPNGARYLASMPTKFRRHFWIKRGDFILVEPIPEGDKVKAEIALILTHDHQRFYRANGCWPQEFEGIDATKEVKGEEDLFVNVNRQIPGEHSSESETDSDDDDDDEEDSEDKETNDTEESDSSDSDSNTQEE
ncbi:DNA polymerase subunit gamma-1, mitochondrial [Gryllus bimaculatus]|nr:DNA polymerase subunit gamma-1, mitochondrial [Gryllus bimaculatus]